MEALFKKYPWLESSVDAGKLAMRVRGVLVALASIVVPALVVAGIGVDQEAVTYIVDVIARAVESVGLLVGIGMSVYGYIRRKK